MAARSVLGQLAAQQGGQRGIGPGVARVVPQRLAGAALRLREVAQLFEHGAQVAVGGGQVGLEPQGLAVVACASSKWPCSCRTQPRPLWASAYVGSSSRARS